MLYPSELPDRGGKLLKSGRIPRDVRGVESATGRWRGDSSMDEIGDADSRPERESAANPSLGPGVPSARLRQHASFRGLEGIADLGLVPVRREGRHSLSVVVAGWTRVRLVGCLHPSAGWRRFSPRTSQATPG